MAVTRNTSRTYFTDTTTVNERPNGSADILEQLVANDSAEGIRDTSATDILHLLYIEMRKMNAYLAEMVGTTLTNDDIHHED
jgi:hypothetical protein